MITRHKQKGVREKERDGTQRAATAAAITAAPMLATLPATPAAIPVPTPGSSAYGSNLASNTCIGTHGPRQRPMPHSSHGSNARSTSHTSPDDHWDSSADTYTLNDCKKTRRIGFKHRSPQYHSVRTERTWKWSSSAGKCSRIEIEGKHGSKKII